MNKKIYSLAVFSLIIYFALSFWMFSRFTVDDAFISWRYGKNLIDTGIWNYNPTTFDLTQAYTNPIYAVLSVVGNYFGVDIVLFFKLFSIFVIGSFLSYFIKRTESSWVMLLLFIGMPATIVHAFGGLETFLFVTILAALMIALYEDKKVTSVLLTLVLFVIRPEAWLLALIVPIYFLIIESEYLLLIKIKLIRQYIRGLRFSWRSGILVLVSLWIPLAIYFLIHYQFFGSALPNTFYAKAGAKFSIYTFITCGFFITPLAVLLVVGRVKLFFATTAFFMAMALSYSTSDLQMNYSARFAYHIFSPIFLFLTYLSVKEGGVKLFLSINQTFLPCYSVYLSAVGKAVLVGFYLIFAMYSSGSLSNLAHMSSYYPRALDSHAELGKTLRHISAKYGLKSFSLGDAGMAAYHSELIALDNIGLGSAFVTRHGIDFNLLDEYGLDFIALLANEEGAHLNSYSQQIIFDWSVQNNFKELCSVYWKKDYHLKIYSKVPIPEIIELCKSSATKNGIDERQYIYSNLKKSPWSYWHE